MTRDSDSAPGAGDTRPSAGARWVVVALFEPLAVGTTFDRSAWPEHVTLASNFALDVPVACLIDAVLRACRPAGPLLVEFAGGALFGPDRNIPVQLVRSTAIVALHHGLADRIESLPGFVADAPGYWRDGYRPHVTLRPSTRVAEGDMWAATGIALAGLRGSTARVMAYARHPNDGIASATAPG
ncbi:2'-5' RNA ligase family protein [Microbacterium sulfonylureivorans]|uniref:2'-5' RNA ligase family protein n=1 Tax=Microbacterium sulfonylureivorans TaxID=2486854 RepID=UPI000FD9EB1B|nr:2'-5' RNA ligase family protein [Microbacterium sulfonylureivorans]